MKFCNQCGATVTLRVPDDDNLPRHICDSCNTIHYQNPKIVAGCIAEWEDKILLCRRAIEPCIGLWTLPAGFMENGETTFEAAARETREEALAEVTDLSLYGMFSLPHINQVYLLFRGNLVAGKAGAGTESLEVRLFTQNEIPWDEIAFPVMTEALQLYYQDRSNTGAFPTRVGDIIRLPDRSLSIKRY